MSLDCDRRRNMRMGVVSLKREVFGFVVEDILAAILHNQAGQATRLAGKLQLRLFQMVRVEMDVTTGPDERAWLKSALARQHVRQERVGGDIEWYAEEKVGASLVKLQVEAADGDLRLE